MGEKDLCKAAERNQNLNGAGYVVEACADSCIDEVQEEGASLPRGSERQLTDTDHCSSHIMLSGGIATKDR